MDDSSLCVCIGLGWLLSFGLSLVGYCVSYVSLGLLYHSLVSRLGLGLHFSHSVGLDSSLSLMAVLHAFLSVG